MRNKWNTESMKAAIEKRVGKTVIIPPTFSYTGIDNLEAFICPTHGEFHKSCYSILRSKYPCHWCCPNHKKTWAEVYTICKNVHGDTYDYSLCENNYKPKYKLEIICRTHGMFKQTVREHIGGSGCPTCATQKKKLTINKFLYDSIKIHGDKYNYSKVFENFKNSKSIVTIICNRHGEFVQRVGDHRRGAGCPLCKLSRGESAVKNYLVYAGIRFTQQKTFDDLISDKGAYYRYDFFLPDFNVLIEFDGAQHYSEVSTFFDIETIKKSDIIKEEYAKRKAIGLVRITDISQIEEKLKCFSIQSKER